MAVNWNDYQPTDWSPGMPITESRMDKLEQGVTDNRDDVQELNNILNGTEGLVNKVNTIGTNVVSDYANKTLWQAIASLYNATNIEGQTQKINQGAEAYAQIVAAVGGYDELGNLKKSLLQRLEGIEQQEANDISDILDAFGRANNIPVFDSTNTVSKAITDLKNILGKNADNTAYYFDDNQNTVAIKMRDLIRRMGDAETELFSNSISGTTYASLSDRLTGITNSLQALGGTNGAVPLVQQELSNAHESSVITVDQGGTQVNKTYDSIDARFEDIESRAETLKDTVGEKINVSAIRNALNVTETGTVLDGRVGKTIRDMLYNTATETAFTASDTVAGRITAAVSDISTLQGAVGETALVSNVVKEEVEGQEVNKQYDDIGERFTDIETHAADMQDNLNDINAELEAAHESSVIKDQVEDEETHEITEVNKQYDSIDSRFEAIETHKKAIADEIEAARTSTIVRTEVPAAEEGEDPTYTDTTYNSLDARLEAIETHAAASRTDLNTIAEELGMMTQAGAIEDTNTKVDRLNDNVLALGKEIGMLSEGTDLLPLADAIDRDGTRIDDIELAIDHVQGENDEIPNGLTQRIEALETTVDTAETGLSARMTAAEIVTAMVTNQTTGLAATKAIADANALAINGQGGLDERISALEDNPVSATEVITEDYIEYDNEGNPTIYITNGENTHIDNNKAEISPDKDYLLEKDHKYYYWKWIDMGNSTHKWTLISGSGGSGTGNTSGMDLTAEEYATIKTNHTYAENTDYYVLEEDGIRHHYRYITTTVNDEPTLTEIEIGIDTDQIKKYNISRVTGKKREYNSQTQTWTETDEDVEYLNLYQYDYGQDNTIIDTQAKPFAQIELPKGGDGGSSSSQKNTLTRIGTEVIQKVTGSKILLRVFFSSYDVTGTESSVGYATLRAGNSVIFSNRELSSYESSVVPNPLTWQENTAGFHEFDVTDYCGAGNTIFTLSVDVGGSAPLGKTWRVNLTELRLESDAPDNLLITVDDEYAFPYTPIGAVNKTLTVTIDKGTENEQVRNVSIPSTISGTSTSYILDPDDLELGHGKHTIELQLFAQIGGVIEPSNKINREYIWYDISDTDTPIIIASQYERTTIEATQYATIEIPYQVYKKDTNTINVEYYLDDEETPYQTSTLVNSNTGTLAYIASDVGDHTLKIKVDDVYIAINLAIARSDKDLSPISGMVIDFDPTTLSNSAANRLPTWNTKINGTNYTFGLTASSNFNWSEDINGGGYKKDENGDRCFVIKAGSYVDLNYPMFANDVFGNGAEMKIIFKTSAVRNAEAVWYKNTGEISGKTVGIQLGTHSGWLKTDKAVAASTSADEDEDEGTITIKGITYYYWQPNIAYNPNDVRIIQKTIYRCTKATTAVDYDLEEADLDEDPYKSYMKNWAKVGQLDTEVIATNSYLYFPYSEEDKIELDININKSNTGNDFIMSYEDGVPSKAYAYTTGAGGDKIAHNNTIHIGSDECDVYIYHLRYYVKSLTTDQILQNFIADGKNLNEKVERYDRNCIYWNPYLNDGDGGYTLTKTSQSSLDPIKLAEKMPDVKVLMLDTDVFTTSKKDFIMNSSLRCIHAEGGNIYKSRGDEDNWFFTNGFHAGQGTTSDNYGQSARNVDFLFEVDAKHWPSKEKNMGKYKISENPNYISTVFKGTEASEFANNSWNASYNEWTADTSYIIGDKVSITDIEDNNKGIIYACTKAHTSDETFDEKNWKKIGTFSKCSDWMADDCKITLTESSVPNNYFNFKANVASSENVNNALFQKRYDDFLVYQSPAQAAQVAKHHDTYENIDDVKVKNCMEFVPAVLFVRENNTDLSKHVEFNDRDWHFYALGNIGDSKKSDYTRAYDPDDMNEFTCENSDNNTNNGQFQSGVFTYQGHVGAIETDYTAWNETTAYVQDATVVYNGMVYTRTGATQEELEEGETYNWVASDWTAITYTGWTDSEPPYFAPRTNPNPMDYTYPISSSQWNVKFGSNYLNRKHMTLVKEKFDGDHSFEFRYACCGDYRDGDRINDTHGDSDIPVDPSDLTKGYKTKDDVQEVLNHDVVLALYEWVITASPEQYVSEAPQWFVKNAMEFFYAYTHYYTMMDNRAKNTFWHFAKTGNYIKVSRPVKELLHVYEVPDGNGGYEPTTDTELDPTNPYYTQYAFDLWVYDCDTALGIDNNGALVFPYGKEDEDYRGEDAASGYAFNGAGSIFWRRLKTTFVDEIADVMTRARDCFDPENLINEFDSFQNCFPEEIWRLDIERKYIRTYTGESIDNSITTNKQNARFLMSMMQGRKKYQRRQWVRDQSFYFNSKYKIGEIEVNKTEFNIVSPAGDHSLLAVSPDYHLHLTPYQDMYINVVVGNGSPIPPIRAKANQEYTIKLDDYTAGNFAETRVYISGFRMISKLGGLAPMYPYAFTLNGLEHLKELDVGTDVAGYTNGNFTELPLTDKVQLPLLEKLNIKNCSSLSTSIGLKTANNLRVVEAAGSSIGGISLPDYTQIEVLHLPVTVTDLVLNNARFLRDFSITDVTGAENYNNLYTLNIENSDYSGTYVWQENTDYIEDEIIVIGNNVYKCKRDHTSVAESVQLDNAAWTSYLTTNWTLVKSNTKLPIDWIDIAMKMLQKNSLQIDIQLLDLVSATIGDIDTLEPLSEAKNDLESEGNALELSGIINVTGAWSVIERDTYGGTSTSVWPNLQFNTDGGTYQAKHQVIYKYSDYEDDNGNIVTGERLKTLYITDGATAPDIYVNGTLSEMPHRDQTARETYEFGMEDPLNDTYIPYSGWKLSSSNKPFVYEDDETGLIVQNYPIVRDDMIIETYFKTLSRTYYIKWYAREGVPESLIKTTQAPVAYGKGEDQEAPTIADIHDKNYPTCTINISNGQATYSIFKGWKKLPTNINPSASDTSYNIYGDWDSGTVVIDDLLNVNNLSNLTPEQLLVLSALDSDAKTTYNISNKIKTGTRVTYNMGQDSIKTGTELVSGNPLRLDTTSDTSFAFDGTNGHPLIQPLKSGNDAFTLAIDYCFNPNATYASDYDYAVLASCYYAPISTEGIRNGLSLYYNIKNGNTSYGPRVGFGDMYNNQTASVAVGSAERIGARNMVVLRHPAGSKTLYVYSGLNGDITTPSSVVVTPLTWNNYNSEAYLCFGKLMTGTADVQDNTPSIVTNGKGTIFWAKYWNEDLGQGECKRIASWPHEQITFAISSISDGRTNDRVSKTVAITPSIYLSALNSSSHLRVYQGRQSQVDGFSGRDNSIARTICNNRIFQGLPTKLQAIMCQPSTRYTVINYDDPSGQQGPSYRTNSTAALGKDYVFQYSIANLTSNSSFDREETIDRRPFAWYDSANVTVYSYDSGNAAWVEDLNSDAKFLNIRCPFKPITWGVTNKMRVFRDTSSARLPTSSNVANSIAATGSIRSGDIYVAYENNTINTYVYVTNSEIQALGIQTILATGDKIRYNTNGLDNSADRPRGGWILADAYWTRSAIYNNGENFAYVYNNGEIEQETTNSAPSSGLNLMYSIAI